MGVIISTRVAKVILKTTIKSNLPLKKSRLTIGNEHAALPIVVLNFFFILGHRLNDLTQPDPKLAECFFYPRNQPDRHRSRQMLSARPSV